MNESVPSARTHARLERLGRVLGVCDGTGPDDDPLLRSLREERWAEGLAEGRTEGRTEGRVETRLEMVRQILLSRGIPVSTEFRGRAAAFAESGEEVLVAAAFACHSERDFYARIARTEDLEPPVSPKPQGSGKPCGVSAGSLSVSVAEFGGCIPVQGEAHGETAEPADTSTGFQLESGHGSSFTT